MTPSSVRAISSTRVLWLTGTLFILAIGLVAWWQQRTLQRLVREETNWQIRLAEENESRRQTALHASLSEARSEGPAHASTDSLPLSVREFFALTDEISADEHKRSQPGEQQKLQDKVERLYARLRATPSNALKEMLAGVESSTMSAEGRRQMPIAILGLLAERDPADAMAVAQTHAASPLAMEVIIRTWVKQDAQAAAQWMMTAEAAGTLPPSLQGDQARLLLLPRLIASNLDGPAIVEMGKLAPGNLDDFLTETVRVLNTAEQRLAFFNRLGQVPDLPADAANQFLRKVGTEISTEAAQSVLLQAAAQWPVEKFDAAAIATSTASIDERTPERAEWLLQNLRGTDREASISKLVETWTHADFNGAAAWLQKQLPSPDRDAAVASFARLVAGREPASAVDWAATIADPASRSASLTRLYRDWARSEPAEAAEYFRDKGLAPTGR